MSNEAILCQLKLGNHDLEHAFSFSIGRIRCVERHRDLLHRLIAELHVEPIPRQLSVSNMVVIDNLFLCDIDAFVRIQEANDAG